MMSLCKRTGSRSGTRLSAEVAAVALALTLLGLGQVLAQPGGLATGIGYSGGFGVIKAKFTISNIRQVTYGPGNVPCPDGPAKVSFIPGPPNGLVINGTVIIDGEFEGVGLGVCASGRPYAISPSTLLVYEIWGDRLVVRIPNQVAAEAKVVPVRVGFAVIQDGTNSVSILTPAP